MCTDLNNNSSSTNCSVQNSHQNKPNQTGLVARLVIFWIIIIVGVIGNSLVIAVVKIIRSMRTTTNYLLVNVAAADITTLVFAAIQFIPQTRHSISSPALGSFLCKFINLGAITIVTLLVTALTLTLLAVERYQALVKPLTTTRRLTTDKIAYVIAIIWIVAIAMVTPLFVTYHFDPKTICTLGDAHDEMVIYMSCLTGILTLFPFMVIIFCYSQIIYGMYIKKTICNNKSERGDTREEAMEKRRLVRVLILLTVVFFVAFIPYGILLILKFSKVNNAKVVSLQLGSQYLTILNCSVNPLIYAFQSSSYRRSFVFIFKKLSCRDTTVDAIELREMRNHSSVRSV